MSAVLTRSSFERATNAAIRYGLTHQTLGPRPAKRSSAREIHGTRDPGDAIVPSFALIISECVLEAVSSSLCSLRA